LHRANILGLFANFPFDTRFVLRAVINDSSLSILSSCFLIVLFVLSYCIHVCERGFISGRDPSAASGGSVLPGTNPGWSDTYGGSIWMTIITMFTVVRF
jgi:hypothetical protein